MKKILNIFLIMIMLFPSSVYAEDLDNFENNEPLIEEVEEIQKKPLLKYKSHVQNIGWQDYVEEDELSGTDHKSLRLESFIIDLENNNDFIEYRSYIEGQGFESTWKKVEKYQVLISKVKE